MTRGREEAIVIGSGIAGLLAARVTSKHFGRVTLVERDPEPAGPAARKGVPQASHIHVLLARGAEVMSELFPDLFEELMEKGSLVADSTEDLAFYYHDRWHLRQRSGIPARLQSRPFLEAGLRERVEAIPNVRVLWGREVGGFWLDAGAVRGARVRSVGSRGDGEDLRADLVVDASGRGSRTPSWLAEAGYERPRDEAVGVKISYASRFFERTPDGRDWAAMLVYPRGPRQERGGALYCQEGNRWIVTLASYRGETPPGDERAFLDFARSLPAPRIHETIRDAKPVSPIHTYRFPGAVRRRYDQLSRPPAGLLVVGDALCSYNPVFGQGMTIAALEARHLDRCLAAGSGAADLWRRFYSAAGADCTDAWWISTADDLRYPHSAGSRPPGLGVAHWYLDRFVESMASDFERYLHFMRVLHLLERPRSLASPRHVGGTLLAWWKGLRDHPDRSQRLG